MKSAWAVIVAAGRGRRFGSAKQFAALKGRPVLDWTLDAFDAHPEVGGIVLVLPDEKDGPPFIGRQPKIRPVVRGGRVRAPGRQQAGPGQHPVAELLAGRCPASFWPGSFSSSLLPPPNS